MSRYYKQNASHNYWPEEEEIVDDRPTKMLISKHRGIEHSTYYGNNQQHPATYPWFLPRPPCQQGEWDCLNEML